MKTHIWPSSMTGKVAAILCLLFIVLMALKIYSFLPFPTFSIAALGVIGFIAGIVAIIQSKDRSVLTIMSIVVGALIIFWIAAEFISPH